MVSRVEEGKSLHVYLYIFFFFFFFFLFIYIPLEPRLSYIHDKMQSYTVYKFRMIQVTKEQELSDVIREHDSERFITYMPHAVHR